MKKISLQWKEPPFGTGRLRIKRATWRTTILRLIRAESQVEGLEFALERLFHSWRKKRTRIAELEAQLKTESERGFQQGREDVLKLLARWGKCRPLEGMGGADMAEALRKVLTPTIAPYKPLEPSKQEDRIIPYDPGAEIVGGQWYPATSRK